MDVRGSYFLVMRGWMVLGVEVSSVVPARAPFKLELLLFSSVLEPVEAHVHGLGTAHLQGAVDNAFCCFVVNDDRGGRLFVAKLFQGYSDGDCLFGIHVHGSKFSFSGGCHDMFDDFGQGQEAAIVEVVLVRLVVKVEMATSTAAGTTGVVVAGIAVEVQYHVTGIVSDDGIRMGVAVIEEVVHGINGALVTAGGVGG